MSKREIRPPLLTVPDVAGWLNISQQTVRRIALDLGALRVAGQLRFRPETIEKYLLSRSLRDTRRGE